VAKNLVDFSAGRLRLQNFDWQVEDSAFIARSRGCVVGHRTGAGKTLMTLGAWDSWNTVSKTLILGTRSSMSTWRKQLRRWADTPIMLLQGASDPDWKSYADKNSVGVWGCTFATFRDHMSKVYPAPKKPPQPHLVVIDELHRILRNRNTQFFTQLRRLQPSYAVGLSATWASRGPQDIWPFLYFVNRHTFPSFWRFVETWCYVEEGTFGKEIYGVKNVANLRTLLRSRYYVSRSVPVLPTAREVIELEPTDAQKKWYDQLDNDMLAVIDGQMVITPNSLAKLTRLRQLSITPKLLNPNAEYGAAIEYILDQVSDDPHTVIFTPFAAAIPYLIEALVKDKYPPEKIFTLQGGDKEDKIDQVEADWKATRGICICSITFANSYRLDTSLTAYFWGFDWDPNNNLQAEGRLRSIESTIGVGVLCRYIALRGTTDHVVKDVVNGKIVTTDAFLHNYKELREAIRHEEPLLADV